MLLVLVYKNSEKRNLKHIGIFFFKFNSLKLFKDRNCNAFIHLISQAGEDVLQFLEDDLIKPTRVLTVGLNNVNDAFELILNYECTGKVSG